jgi:cellulose synthase/poly-beta-1,6-N-acetylglucosamine synthase-like glycosyltransferase
LGQLLPMNMIEPVALFLVLGAAVLFVYAYLAYPAALWVLGRFVKAAPVQSREPDEWPVVSITVPVYNEEHQVASLVENLLALDYPPERRQILIVSDASSDGTDEIVRGYGDQGVELLQLEERGGKTKAENLALPWLRGEIIVNTDASIRFPPESLKRLVSAFSDPAVGLASGRDLSVPAAPDGGKESNLGESGYVGYEMSIRDLETSISGIVGASGCYYGIRRCLHTTMVPESLSRDFAAALHTTEEGYRAVSVPGAICFVPRTSSLRREYSRKVRTITRGMKTLHFKRILLNPVWFGIPAWMLLSHKICRWALPWATLLGVLGLVALSSSHRWAAYLLALFLLFLVLAGLGWAFADRRALPKVLSIPAFLVVGNVAAAHAFLRFLQGNRSSIWEPTRRGPA